MKEFHLSSTQIHIINQLLDAHEPLSSQFLANGLGVSSKTIRKCIEEAQDLLKINGANIEIKPGSGYRLIIEDDEAFDEFKQVEQLGKQNRNVFSINLDRAHLVVRYLLTHNEKISIEDLCDLLYINRTSAKKVLGKAREILARFNLAAVFQSKKGIVVVGEEKDIRLCLVYEYSYFMTSYHFHGQDEYKDIIGLNDPYFNEVENLIISFQNNFEEYNLSSYSVMYIARLIIVSKNRITMSHPLILDDEITKHYCNRNTYFVAKMILKECEKLYNIPFSSYDNILVAMCLVALRVTIKEPEVYRFGYFEHKDLALDIAQELARVNMFSSSKQDIKLIEDLSYNIEGLLTRYKYHILTSQFRLVGYPSMPQMARKMALQVAYYLEKTKNIKLMSEDIIRLMMVIYPLYGRYPFTFNKFDACIISGIDKTEGKGLKERLLRNFGTYIKEIDLLERYEARYTDLSKYKVIFSSCSKELLNLPEDIMFINTTIFFNEVDKEKYRKQFVNLAGESGLSSSIDEYTTIFSGLNPHNKMECLEMISNKLIKEKGADDSLLNDLLECERIMQTITNDNVVLLTGIESHTENIQINVFVLDKPVSWIQGSKARIVVYWDRGKDVKDSNNFENEHLPHILDRFFHNAGFIDDFIKNPTIEQFYETIQEIDGQVMTNGTRFQ